MNDREFPARLVNVFSSITMKRRRNIHNSRNKGDIDIRKQSNLIYSRVLRYPILYSTHRYIPAWKILEQAGSSEECPLNRISFQNIDISLTLHF